MDVPAPSESVKNQALEAALHAFDKKNLAAAQGKAKPQRLTGINNSVRRFIMQKKYIVSGLMGGVAVCCFFAVMGTPFINQQMNTMMVDKNIVSSISTGGLSKEATSGAASEETVLAYNEQAAPEARMKAEIRPEPSSADSQVAPVAEVQSLRAVEAEKASGPGLEAKRRVVQEFATGGSVAPAAAPVMQMNNMDSLASSVMGSVAIAPSDFDQQGYYKDTGRDKFNHVEENAVKQVVSEPVSTFSADVDTASYSFMRRMLNQGVLPQKDAVRTEEMINYFPYSYAVPENKDAPFQPNVTVYDSPWKKGNKLVHIGIKGYELANTSKPHTNLVFLVDTSGSMNSPDKLPLVKNALKMLLDTLNPDDTIGIVTYAGSAGTALEPTKVSEKQKIIDALDSLGAGGSTAGAEGIRQAYNLAQRNQVKDGVNRVILATDGDFNVGITDQNELKSFIERERDTGIFLSVIGFGQGNYNDGLMQTLAQNGNGTASYIDNLGEARKVLVQEASSTLFTIAKDVKLQVEFNPATVKEYRLVGYETRHLNREDFNNDKVDAGDIGAGHTVTAIYEITPVGAVPAVDDLRYGSQEKAAVEPKKAPSGENEYAFLKIRYKLPNENTSRLITRAILPTEETSFDKASSDARFATAVAGFAELLKGGKYAGTLTYDQVVDIANAARGSDEFGYRAEFVNLVRLAKSAGAIEPQRQ